MIQLRDADNIYLEERLAGFTKQLATSGVVERQVDLLLVGVAYAIRNRLPPLEALHRHELIRVASLDPDVRLATEACLVWYAREMQLPQPKNPRELLDLLGRAGSAGLSTLRKEWEALSPGQLKLRLLGLHKL